MLINASYFYVAVTAVMGIVSLWAHELGGFQMLMEGRHGRAAQLMAFSVGNGDRTGSREQGRNQGGHSLTINHQSHTSWSTSNSEGPPPEGSMTSLIAVFQDKNLQGTFQIQLYHHSNRAKSLGWVLAG